MGLQVDRGIPLYAAIIDTKPKQAILDTVFDKRYTFWLTYIPMPDEITTAGTTTIQTTNNQDRCVFLKFVQLCAEYLMMNCRNLDGSTDNELKTSVREIMLMYKAMYDSEISETDDIESPEKLSACATPGFGWF